MTVCDLCGSDRLHPPWNPEDPWRCMNCGASLRLGLVLVAGAPEAECWACGGWGVMGPGDGKRLPCWVCSGSGSAQSRRTRLEGSDATQTKP